MNILLLWAVTLGSLTPQATNETFKLQVSVADPYAPAWIQEASITDLTSGEQITTNSNGIATFSRSFLPDEETTLVIQKVGYPDSYRLVALPSGSLTGACFSESTFNITACFSPERLYLLAPVGPAGGERTIWHPTGQMKYAFDGDPSPIEYLQRVRVEVPPGALETDYRIGITPILAEAFNNSFMDSVAPSTFPLAQFRIDLFDLQGNKVPEHTFHPAIRVEIASAFVGMPITVNESPVFRCFDEGALQWTSSGIVGSGVLPGGSAYVELSHFTEVGCFQTSHEPLDFFWIFDRMYKRPCADPNGSALSCSNVLCGTVDGLAEAEEEIEGSVVLDEEAETGFKEELKSQLFKLGFTAKA